MILGLTVAALAAPPEGVDVQAVEVWQERAGDLRHGPTGCYRLEGTARNHIAVYRPPSLFSRSSQSDYVYEGTFSGQFDNGQWTDFVSELKPVSESAKDEEGAEWKIPVHPLVGRGNVQYRDPDPDEEGGPMDGSSGTRVAVSRLDLLLDEIQADVTTTFSEWSDERDGVELTEWYPLANSGKQVELVTLFPQGADTASALDVRFPKRLKVPIEGAPIRITLLRPQVHVRTQAVDGEPMPVYESLSVAVGAFGFTLGFEQRMTYTRATPCPPSSPASTPEVPPGG